MDSRHFFNISTQQIQIFLKAVEFKNFTQTAAHFNFTPSMVSKTISAMEEELKVTLFVRKPHDLSPTAAAVFLAGEWRQTIASLANTVERARLLQEQEGQKITLGFVDSSAVIDNLIMNAVRSYTDSHPGVRIMVEKHDMHRAAELLNSGLLDIILTSEMEVPYLDDHGLSWEKTVDTGVAVYVPSSNPLFDRGNIRFEDLSDQTFISLDPTMHPSYNQWLTNLCARHGFMPRIAASYRTVRSLMFSLKLCGHVFLGDTITSDWCGDGLKMFPLPETSFTLVAWRGGRDAGAVTDFKNHLKSLYPDRF